jgi:hypothetical protein
MQINNHSVILPRVPRGGSAAYAADAFPCLFRAPHGWARSASGASLEKARGPGIGGGLAYYHLAKDAALTRQQTWCQPG